MSEGDGIDNHTKQTDPSVEYLVQMFSEEFLWDLARKTEFIKRQRKIDPVIFFWVLILGFGAYFIRSIRALERRYETEANIKLSDGALYDRFTPELDDYTYILPDYYADTCIDYGQLVKIRENGRVVRKEKRTIYGNPDPGDIETTDVENYNGILRDRIGRFGTEDEVFLETEVDAKMFAPTVSILLEFHKRVQKNNFSRNVGRIGGSPVDLARIFLFPINYLGLGHSPIILTKTPFPEAVLC